MKELCCDRCGAGFGYTGKQRTRVSCPACGAIIDVQVCLAQKQNPTFKVSRVSPSAMILEPEKLSGKYRCLKCAKLFVFEKDPGDTYTKPHCSLCGHSEVVPLTPLARMEPVRPGSLLGKKTKLVRFVRRNFKALVEARTFFKGVEPMIKRLALPPKAEEKFLRISRNMIDAILTEAEAHKNELLRKRMTEMGVADGEAGI